jgi:hypothetical protein
MEVICFVIIRAYLGWPLKTMSRNCQIIGISFCHNIVCENIVSDERLRKIFETELECE